MQPKGPVQMQPHAVSPPDLHTPVNKRLNQWAPLSWQIQRSGFPSSPHSSFYFHLCAPPFWDLSSPKYIFLSDTSALLFFSSIIAGNSISERPLQFLSVCSHHHLLNATLWSPTDFQNQLLIDGHRIEGTGMIAALEKNWGYGPRSGKPC